MSITPLPTPPSSADPANFDTRADAFLGALPTFATETNDVANTLNPLAGSADDILAVANYKGLWSSLTGALAIPATVFHSNQLWLLTESVADVTAVEPGVDAVWFLVSRAAVNVQTFTTSGTWQRPNGNYTYRS